MKIGIAQRRKLSRWFILPRNVRCVRSGVRDYYYFCKGRGPIVRLHGHPVDHNGLPNATWWAAYRALMGPNAPPFTLAELVADYFASAAWQGSSPATRNSWGPRLTRLARQWGQRRVASISTRDLFRLRDALERTPGTANVTLGALSALLSWGVAQGHLEHNPCLGHPQLLSKSRCSYDAWTEADVALLHRVATPDLWQVAALSLSTAQPLATVLALTWEDVRDRNLIIAERSLALPLQGDLATTIAALPRRCNHLLSDARGRPWLGWRFRMAWRDQMRAHQLAPLRARGCVFSGLRRTAITRMVLPVARAWRWQPLPG